MVRYILNAMGLIAPAFHSQQNLAVWRYPAAGGGAPVVIEPGGDLPESLGLQKEFDCCLRRPGMYPAHVHDSSRRLRARPQADQRVRCADPRALSEHIGGFFSR